jgi:hypothetical protein
LTSFPPKSPTRPLALLGTSGDAAAGTRGGDRRGGMTVEDSEAAPRAIPARTVIWAAGDGSAMARQLGEATGADVDRAGASRRPPTSPLAPGSRGIRARRRWSASRGRREPEQLLGGRAVAMAGGALRGQRCERIGCAVRTIRAVPYRDKATWPTIAGRRAGSPTSKGSRSAASRLAPYWLGIHIFLSESASRTDPRADPLVVQLLHPRSRRPG